MDEQKRPYRDARNRDDWQKAQFEILLKFDEFCTLHNLTYSLDFGSMIGAIRHRGYIPWDNDIDVSMVQSEYDKLVDLALNGIYPEGCTLLDRRLDKDYQLSFGRLADTSTTCLFGSVGWLNDKGGAFIDIFAFRPLPMNKRKRKNAIRDFLVFEEASSTLIRRAGSRPLNFKLRYVHYLIRKKFFGQKKAFEWIERQANKGLCRDSEWFYLNSGGMYEGSPVRRKEWINEVIRLPFWGHMLPVFTGYLHILREDYGDNWRYYPSDTPQFDPYSANLNIPSSFIFEDYNCTMDRKSAIKTYEKYKSYQMRDMLMRGLYSPEIYKLKFLASLTRANEARNHINYIQATHDLSSAFNKEYAEEIVNLFEEFYQAQTSNRSTFWHIGIPIQADMLTASMWAWLSIREEYWIAHDVLRKQLAYAKNKKALFKHPAIKKLSAITQVISNMHLAMDEGNIDKVSELHGILRKEAPFAHERRIGSIWLAAHLDPESIYSETIQEDFACCQSNGEYLAYYANALDKLGKTKEAKRIREEALNNTTNGVVILELTDKLGGEAHA